MRIKIFAAIIIFSFFVLGAGLFYTQILRHDTYSELSEKNRIRVLPLAAPRGRVYDRNGTLLVSNEISFDVEVVYQEIKDKQKIIDTLILMLSEDKDKLTERIEAARKKPFVPVKIAEDVKKDMAIKVEEVTLDLPGVIVTTRPRRNYIYKNALSHVTGYIGKISEAELKRYKTYGYRMQDFVGKDGIERQCNDYLRGIDGGLQVEVDSRGRQVRILALKEPIPGKDVYLSIDARLQEFCDSVLGKKKGAVIAMDPETGAVLALVSNPDYDPNIFVTSNNTKKRLALLNDSRTSPMLNRAIGTSHPLGSVFKIVIAAAALEEGKFTERSTLSCNGAYYVGGRAFHCWREKGHGGQNITQAMKHSCNVFFYQLGISLGADKIAQYAFKFGLGKPSGIDLPGETGGFVPTISWKKTKLRQPWFKGETANYSIGQGYLLVTPLQASRLTGAVAAGGKLARPFLVERIGDVTIRQDEPENLNLKRDTLRAVKKALKDVVNAPRGTGVYARSKKVTISGKTGTAQNPRGRSHAWFVGFAPFEKPGISVVVFLEHGGKGGLEPARFAKKIIEKARELELL
ncbi:penicillin-binding protein 2 [Candidatus Omnitrophota bacterium]